VNTIERLAKYPYLKSTFYAYLLLAVTDVIHHWHAAVILGDEPAMHAVYIGLLLMPVSVFTIVLFTQKYKVVFLATFISISALAMLIPGIYHGGWHHFAKILEAIYSDNESKNIHLLFPYDNLNLWFHEISGLLEFSFALALAFFLCKTLANGTASNLLIGAKR